MSITTPFSCSSCWGTGINVTGAACKSCWPASRMHHPISSAPEVDQLRSELANMTAQRDWMAMRFDALEAGSAADRLDAQRYRWLRDIGDKTWTPFSKRAGFSAEHADALIDAAITTGEQL